MTIVIAKPPEGLFVTDAVKYATYKLYINMGGDGVRIYESPSKIVLEPISSDYKSFRDRFLDAYNRLIDETLSRASNRKTDVPLTGNDKKSIVKYVNKIGLSLSFKRTTEFIELYRDRFLENIEKILEELGRIEYSYENIVSLGGNEIACPNILKLNYYKYRRGLCLPRIEANLRMGLHYLTFSLIGALLSKAGTKRSIGVGGWEIHGYYAFPDSYDGLEMAEVVADSIRRVRFQRSPDELFFLYMALNIKSPRALLEDFGRIPQVKLYIIKEPGNRSDLYSVLYFGSGDTGELSSRLRGRARRILINLLIYVLSNWDRRDRLSEQDSAVMDYIYNICKYLYLAETGSLPIEEAVPIVYRLLYMPISQDEKLSNVFKNKFGLDINEFKDIFIENLVNLVK